MGAFFIVRGSRDERSPVMARLETEMARLGLAAPRRWEGRDLGLRLYRKIAVDTENFHARNNGDFAFSTGTFIYRGAIGAAALKRLLADFEPPEIDWDRARGNFCVGVYKGGALQLFTDRLGVYKVYRDREDRVFSSAFLATLAAVARPRISAQGVYEYVFQGATYGDETIIDDIGLLDADATASIGAKVAFRRHRHRFDLTPSAGSLEDHVARNVENLRAFYGVIADLFGDRIDTALSGGYDSRLTLALLHDRGVRPKVHVYGRPSDSDVVVAKRIAAGEGFEIAHVDKSDRPRLDVDDFAATIERNFRLFDGYPTDGIFDDGGDIATRRDRCAGGELMLNGGGGEVFRNFFYLLGGSYRVRQFLSAFYARFAPAVCSPLFDADAYLAALGDKVRRVLGHDRDRLTRTEIEYLYPAFRCRYWMGRNNSINGRLGWTLTPFIESAIVADALRAPLAYKTHGILEGRMIRALNPGLAAYPSSYDHDFARDPPLKTRLKDYATLLRPTMVRRYAYRLKMPRTRAFPHVLAPPYIDTVIDRSFPVMSTFFRVDAITDPSQFTRIATLEYLFARYPCSAPLPPSGGP